MANKERTSKEILEEYLSKIGWSVKDIGAEHYSVVNHKGVRTGWVLWDNALTYDKKNYGPEDDCCLVSFRVVEEHFRVLDGDSISIGPHPKKYPFILFMNHDMKKQDALVSGGDE